MDEKETLDIYCPKCNVQVVADVVAKHTRAIPQEQVMIEDPVDTPLDVTVFSLASCRRCKEVFLTKCEYYEIPGEVVVPQTDLITIYPTPRDFDESLLPATAAWPYREAARSYQAGLYYSCVIMCRKCLEAICYENGLTKQSLKARLDSLHEKGLIDAKLFTWATGLRLVGNDAAHDVHLLIDVNDAKDSLEFIEALFLYLFSLDLRFQEFQKRRQVAKSATIPGSSGE